MTSDIVPVEVQNLLRERVETFEQLEVLVLLASDRRPSWTMEDVAAELTMPEDAVSEAMKHLLNTRLILALNPEGRGYACHPDAETIVHTLADAYRDDRPKILRLMTENALNRIRTSAIRAFASAFQLGRKRDG